MTIELKPYIKDHFNRYTKAIKKIFAKVNGDKAEKFLAKEDEDDNAVIINKQVDGVDDIVTENYLETQYNKL